MAALLIAPALVAPLDLGSIYDGGITSSAGTFIRHGLVPYRDFWLLYGPSAAILAAALGVIEPGGLVLLRLAGLFTHVLIAGVGTLIAARFVQPPVAAFVAVIASVAPVAFLGTDLAPWPMAMLLVLSALAIAGRGGRSHLLVAGVLCGVAVTARQDLGAYGLVAVVVAVRSLWPAIGFLAVVAPYVAVLVALAPVADLWAQLIVYPLQGPSQFRSLPIPGLTVNAAESDALRALLIYPALVVIALVIFDRSRGRSRDPIAVGLLVLAIATRPQAMLRSDEAHAAMTLAPALLLSANAAAGRMGSPMRRIVAAVLIAPLASLLLLPALRSTSPPSDYARGIEHAAALAKTVTRPGERIFVGLQRNRHAFHNPLVVYHLADRPTGVRDSMYNPGVTTTNETQIRMIGDLSSGSVDVLVLDVNYASCWEPANLSREPGSSLLDDMIERDYRVIADLGVVVIMARNESDLESLDAPLVAQPVTPRIEGTLVCASDD